MSIRLQLLGIAFLASFSAMSYGAGCSAGTSDNSYKNGAGGSGIIDSGIGDGNTACGFCSPMGNEYTGCDAQGNPLPKVDCGNQVCANGLGCVDCRPNYNVCVGNEVHVCGADGKPGDLVQACDVANGELCAEGKCGTECEIASDQPSNVGCEFWAVDLDQQDKYNDPASAPWGVVLSNGSKVAQANVTIEINNAAPGEPLSTEIVKQITIQKDSLEQVILPTRELDCGTKPNEYASPGTCLSSRAFRITSSAPIIVYQFNVFENAYSNDASLLLPTNALGYVHRVMNWVAGHPAPTQFFPDLVDRSYVTIVGTKSGTHVKVRPSWRIRGNAPVPAGGPELDPIEMDIGPFDVLNLETDNATLQEMTKNPWATDLTGTIVESSQPVAVFSGVETTSAPAGVEIPTYQGWNAESCCLDHLEDQIMPAESVGKNYVITRSPVRSTGSFREPDVIRFLGVAEPADVTTNLPSPYDKFTIQPGEVVTTWTQNDVVVSATAPVMVGQYLISQGYVEGATTGDPSMTIYPPVDQFRTEYVFLTPGGWSSAYVVIASEKGSSVTLDGAAVSGCVTETAGQVDGKTYESHRCAVQQGVHHLTGDKPFGIVAYGYGSAGSYAHVGGADVKRIYDVPPIK